MDEFKESGEKPLEVKLEEIKNLVMKQLGIETNEDWDALVEESTEAALLEITETDGTPVDPEKLSKEEKQEAVFNYLYTQYIFAETGDDPMGLFE